MSINILTEEEQILILKYNQQNRTIYCSKCHSTVLNNDDFCYNCGNKLNHLKHEEQPHKINFELNIKYASVYLLRELKENSNINNKKINFLPFKPINLLEVLDYISSEKYIESVEDKEDSYKLTDKGNDFYKKNHHTLYYNDIFYDFDIEYYDSMYNNSNKELKIFLIDLLNNSINDAIQELKWKFYSELLYKTAHVYDEYDEHESVLYYVLQHFICELNPFIDNNIKSLIEIPSIIKNRVIYSLYWFNNSYDKCLEILNYAYADLNLPKNYISQDKIELLLEELFDTNTEFRLVNNHLVNIYGVERINIEETSFNNLEEQEEVIKKLDEYFK